ncbi:MAG: hypothetical protein KF819_39255 [Labilithrix sp.]|nr:hypothetical protein [Labilithrix sp.]
MSDETETDETESETEATAEPKKGSKPPPAKAGKKRKSAAEVQKELRELSKAEEKPPADLKKIYLRGGAVVLVVWIIAGILRHPIGFAAAGALTIAGVVAMLWLQRYMKKTQALGALLKGADTEEGRKHALERIDADFKKGDTQAVIAKAQLQMQDDPRAALATLEAVNLDKELAPIAGQIRAMRAMIHLTLGETQEARALADKLDLGKQQEPKTRVMFAAVASEAWARTGQGKKAVDTLDLFNPEAPDMGELRAQLWRSRAFAYAAVNDTKGVARAVKKLADINPHLLGMFVGQKKVHPLLEREAKQIVMRLGIVPRKMVRQKM